VAAAGCCGGVVAAGCLAVGMDTEWIDGHDHSVRPAVVQLAIRGAGGGAGRSWVVDTLVAGAPYAAALAELLRLLFDGEVCEPFTDLGR
jgi:hypothetical protein